LDAGIVPPLSDLQLWGTTRPVEQISPIYRHQLACRDQEVVTVANCFSIVAQ
jgi:hypothetical protein